ncbi:glycosyltransferase family 2 protein [Bacteroides sp.]
MTFSVIIPVYNVENYLRECIDSIVNQTCQDFELVLVDNGSTDSSGKVCDEYASKYSNVVVEHLMPNVGASGARNIGQDKTKGDYILFIDSDDYYINHNVFEKLKERTTSNPDVIHFKFVEYYEATGKLGTCTNHFNVDPKGKNVVDVCNELINNDSYQNSAWSKAIKREILVKNDIRFTNGLSVEDNDWYYRVILNVKSIELLDEPVYVYRRRITGSITTTATIKNTIDCLDVIEKWIRIIDENKSNPNTQIILGSLAKQYCNYLIGYSKLPYHEESFKRFKKYNYLLKISNNKRVRIFRKVSAVLGLKGLIYGLKKVQKIK